MFDTNVIYVQLELILICSISVVPEGITWGLVLFHFALIGLALMGFWSTFYFLSFNICTVQVESSSSFVFFFKNQLATIPGLWSFSSCTWSLDDARQSFFGGVVEEPVVPEHHLHHPLLLHPHDPPLRLWLVRCHEGDQVLPPQLLRPPLPPLHHHHDRRGSSLFLQRAGLPPDCIQTVSTVLVSILKGCVDHERDGDRGAKLSARPTQGAVKSKSEALASTQPCYWNQKCGKLHKLFLQGLGNDPEPAALLWTQDRTSGGSLAGEWVVDMRVF